MAVLDENELIFRELCRKAIKELKKIAKIAERRLDKLRVKGYAYKFRYSTFLSPRGAYLIIEVYPTDWHFYKEKRKLSEEKKAKD
ncbi:hypothetical protein J7K06_05535 [Candidatus Bathyarchaeota archaeon]|nr:hypothetical protein [Candidatus Bathyarchaeota archaeon]